MNLQRGRWQSFGFWLALMLQLLLEPNLYLFPGYRGFAIPIHRTTIRENGRRHKDFLDTVHENQ
jgi:hypothetical protein